MAAESVRIAPGTGAVATGPVPTRGWTEIGLALMVLVWGVNFSVVKSALAAFSPLAFNSLRFLVASAFVFGVLRLQGPLPRPERRDVLRLAALGIIGNVLYQVTFVFGIDLTRAGNASVLLALSPLFVTLLSALAGHERPGPVTWLGGALSLSGVALISGGNVALGESGQALLGDGILVLSALIWAGYTVGAKPLIERYGSVPVTAWTLWTGAAGMLLLAIPSLARQEWSAVGPGAWGGLLFSACFAIGLAYLIWYRGVERIGNTRTAVYSNLTPAVALIVAALALGERLTVFSVAGALLTLGGVLLVRADPRRARAA
jgi:drug/metabolite transporter (DMT)-like permease